MPRSRGHHFTLPKFHIDHGRNLKLMYGLRVCRDLMNKFTLFFMPIFLFEVGRSTVLLNFVPLGDFQRGMLAISLYYLVSCSLSAVSGIWFGKLTTKIGYQKSFVLSYLLHIVEFIMLFYLRSTPLFSLYLLAAILHGLQSPIFWGSYLTVLSKNARRAHMGQDMGLLQILLQVVAVISPALSGIIAFHLGMEILFLLGIMVALLSIIITLFMDDQRVNYKVNEKEFFSWLRERRYERLAISMMGKYIYDAMIYLWPLYVFILLGTVDKVGYLYTISLFLAMLVTFFVGVYIDKSKDKKPFFVSGGILSLVWLARTQIYTVWGIVLSDVFDRLAANVHGLFFNTAVIKRGKGSKAFSYFVYREVIINVAAVIFWTMFTIFFLLSGGWTGMFILASVGVLLSLLIRETKEVELA